MKKRDAFKKNILITSYILSLIVALMADFASWKIHKRR